MKTWFITGVSRGFGKALAEAALARGDKVIGTIRSDNPGIADPEGGLTLVKLDVTDRDAVRRAVESAFADAGRIDVIVNNAGYGMLGATEAITDEQLDHVFAVNFFGTYAVCRAAAPFLRKQRSGHIINITSMGGRRAAPGAGAYAATKFAVEGMGHALHAEMEPFGVRVTSVEPGAFRTDFLSDHSIRMADRIEEYDDTVGVFYDRLASASGLQPGDPVRAAEAMIKLVEMPDPPFQLLLGRDAYESVGDEVERQRRELAAHKELSLSTDFPQGT
ncbi:short-chain dehydrogenase/reductase [Novosphingobium marinum]|uniref:NAD(P)-dependent dehydrogenase (Short-subunit alcohol dehydrogenase family) n=1 Tax=Novosphingobium marinum TaxID=1514948 RepID=A0A7Z0BRF1_9SPHN|nr:oxidoreductase [Novosphingobium marinum]NYH93786.1 NAD(P)-dependent dehydrogenase (short-subunit alcohol dehydrogenase family) [Novosphingobium marinum]GGC17266.1 short-chain dehydrogenase/reductase [Novosphingobium marinum]